MPTHFLCKCKATFESDREVKCQVKYNIFFQMMYFYQMNILLRCVEDKNTS